MTENDVLTQKNGNYTLSIFLDEFAHNPREEFENLGTLYIPRPPRGYAFSDKNANAEEAKAAPVKIPVYILDHSGIALSYKSFNDSWDSWNAGIMYVTENKLNEKYGSREDAKKIARDVLKAELQ